MSDKMYNEYVKIEDAPKMREDLAPDELASGAFYSGLRQASNNYGGINNPKTKWIIDKLKKDVVDRKIQHKTLIYSTYKFSKIVGKKTPLNHATKYLSDHKINYGLISGNISKADRKRIVDKYNSGEYPVLFISKAGSEGLDLKETRNVIIIEPTWNREMINQTIGRAVRYKSHAALSPKERVVNVYELLAVKPDGVEDDMISVDKILFNYSRKKTSSNRTFSRRGERGID